ncbi:MAG: TatD family hydrolase [bacterium]
MEGLSAFPTDSDVRLIDTHAHLYEEYYDGDIDEILDELREDMFRMLVVGVDLETSKEALELARQEDFIYAAAGIHPNRARKLSADELYEFEDLLCQENIVAVGEIGLDYYHEEVDRETQQYMLNQFTELAHDLHLPITFHVRPKEDNAEQPVFDDLFPIMEAHGGPELLGIFHCFGGNTRRLTECLDYQFFISFAGNLTYPRALELQAVAKEVPMDRILVETDCPYLTPEPQRGKQNQPNYVWPVYQKIAELKDWSTNVVVDKIWENTEKLFGWSPDKLAS